jgi:hypothetical protein
MTGRSDIWPGWSWWTLRQGSTSLNLSYFAGAKLWGTNTPSYVYCRPVAHQFTTFATGFLRLVGSFCPVIDRLYVCQGGGSENVEDVRMRNDSIALERIGWDDRLYPSVQESSANLQALNS